MEGGALLFFALLCVLGCGYFAFSFQGFPEQKPPQSPSWARMSGSLLPRSLLLLQGVDRWALSPLVPLVALTCDASVGFAAADEVTTTTMTSVVSFGPSSAAHFFCRHSCPCCSCRSWTRKPLSHLSHLCLSHLSRLSPSSTTMAMRRQQPLRPQRRPRWRRRLPPPPPPPRPPRPAACSGAARPPELLAGSPRAVSFRRGLARTNGRAPLRRRGDG